MSKKNKGKVVQMLSPENYIRQKARSLPIFECRVNTGWEEDGIANISVARKHTNGNLTVGFYLVDLACLGVKDAHYKFNIPEYEYRELLVQMEESMDMEETSYTIAHNIIFAGLEFAEEYSFKPHKDFTIAQFILEEDTDDIELIEIDCGGDDGNPLYVQGPLDNNQRANRVIAHLEKYAGPGNYDFILAGDEDFDDDEWDEDENDEREKWDEKYGDLSLDKKIDLFEKSITNLENLPEDEQKEFGFLVYSILDNYIDADMAGSLTDKLLNKLEEIEVTEEPLTDFLGIKPTTQVEKEELQRQVIEIYKTANSNTKEAKNQLNRLKKIYPDVPVMYFLENILFQSEQKKSNLKRIEEYHLMYPDYGLFKVELSIERCLSGEKLGAKELFEKGTEAYFPGRTKLHPIEMFHYLMLLTFASMVEQNINCLEALNEAIEEIDMEGADYQQISEMIVAGRISFILSLKDQTNKKSSSRNNGSFRLPF